MQLSNLRTLCRLSVPAAKISRISNANLDLIINEVVKDINARLRLLNQDDKFNVIVDQYKYDLGDSTETVARFFKIDNLGLYWNAGSVSSTNWKRLYPKTVKWLDKNFPQWRDADSGDPMYYAKKGKYLYLYPTPSEALTDGLWLYYIEATRTMSANAHFPFGYEDEISEYSILTDVIIAGVKHWAKPMMSTKGQPVNTLKNYLSLIEIKRAILKENLDISSDKKTKFKIKHVC